MKRLMPYKININTFDPEQVWLLLKSSYHLTDEWKPLIDPILQCYLAVGKISNFQEKVLYAKLLKDQTTNDLKYFINNQINKISDINRPLAVKLIVNKTLNRQEKQDLISTFSRLSEFYYLSDKEMKRLSEDIELFIKSGDCKLFDYINNPYLDFPLEKDFETDILNREPQVLKYIEKQNQKIKDLGHGITWKIISAKEIQEAMDEVEHMITDDINNVPLKFRGIIQVCQEIRLRMDRQTRDGIFDWENPRAHDGIYEEHMMTKRSGFCLNKEHTFRLWLDANKMKGWMNPEGSVFRGTSSLMLPTNWYHDTCFLEWWKMDVIYYSLGKGSCFKTRYVGQPAAFFQNLAEPLHALVKASIIYCVEKYKNPGHSKEIRYDPGVINIYDNYDSLLDMISKMEDGFCTDFSSYSDYLNRNCFDWIMNHMWGIPKWYRQVIMHLMSLPVKVNDTVLDHLHGSVMGIKVNFLLITFANCLMWMIGCIISNNYDYAKFMGDDRIQVDIKEYTEEIIGCHYSVTAYFNCVLNPDKTEWLKQDGYVSFCKRRFNKYQEQISGFSGEYLLKTKCFLSDYSTWMYLMDQKGMKNSILEGFKESFCENLIEYAQLTYYKFYKSGDPTFEEMISIMTKIPYIYGGWNLEEGNELLGRILLESVIQMVDQIIMQSDKEAEEDPNLRKIRQLMKDWFGEDNRYYQHVSLNNNMTKSMDRIKTDILTIEEVLDNNITDYDIVNKAHKAMQSIQEIILQKDSRLNSSISTKNRVEITFDQDSIIKLRNKFLAEIIKEESVRHSKSRTRDEIIRMACLEDPDPIKGWENYRKFIDLQDKCKGHVKTYYDAFGVPFIGVELIRIDGYDEDNHPIRAKYIKRLTSEDSSYALRKYDSEKRRYIGKFINTDMLNDNEINFISFIRNNKGIQDRLLKIDKWIETSVEGLADQLFKQLVALEFGRKDNNQEDISEYLIDDMGDKDFWNEGL